MIMVFEGAISKYKSQWEIHWGYTKITFYVREEEVTLASKNDRK